MRVWVLLITVGFIASAALAQPSTRVDRVARLVERGQAHQAVGDTVSALGLYRDAIGAGPRRSEGYVALGELYMELGEPSRALEVFEVGTRMAGQSDSLWLGLANALRALGQEQRALEALRTLRGTTSGSLSGLQQLAEAAEARGAFIEALSVRRARLDRLEQGRDAAALAEERARVRALERMLGAGERVRTREDCGGDDAVLRALARCP